MSTARIAVDDTPSTCGATTTLEAEPLEELEVAGSPHAEAEVLAGDHGLCADRPQVALGEVLGGKALELCREGGDERGLDARGAEELEPTVERRQQVDPVAEGDARVRVERDRGRSEPGRDDGREHRPVSSVDAVERADGDRARAALHAPPARARRSSEPCERLVGGRMRSGSASSTENGPISVRRSATQWPPSASAIERTYVPEETRSSIRATPSS